MRFVMGLWLLFAAAPFWEAKAPQQWTDHELGRMFTSSPWAQSIDPPPRSTGAPAVSAYIASAVPMQQAEAERERRASARSSKPAPEDPLAEEYQAYLRENQGKRIILAMPYPYARALADNRETSRLQEQSALKIGRKKFKMTGYFSPSSTDPCLRLFFPREVEAGAKTLVFELYLPGVPSPYRTVEFSLRDLVYNGKPEF